MLALAAATAQAELRVAAQFGREVGDDIDSAGIGLSFPTGLGGEFQSAAWDATLNVDVVRWSADAREGTRRHVLDVGLTPQLRLRWPRDAFVEPFVDLGVGLHLLSAHDLGDRHLGTVVQFGEYVGLGVRFGERREWAVGLRLLHESNASFDGENGGLTTVGLRLEYARASVSSRRSIEEGIDVSGPWAPSRRPRGNARSAKRTARAIASPARPAELRPNADDSGTTGAHDWTSLVHEDSSLAMGARHVAMTPPPTRPAPTDGGLDAQSSRSAGRVTGEAMRTSERAGPGRRERPG